MSFPSSDNGEDCLRHQQTVHNMQPFCYFSISYQSYHSMMLERSGETSGITRTDTFTRVTGAY